jgi:hypothetical protein
MSVRTIRRLVVGLSLILVSCGALPTAGTTTTTSPITDGRETATTSVADPAPTTVPGAINVALRLPSGWSEAVVWGRSDDYPNAQLAWEVTGSTLDVALPGEGGYQFWAESPSSDDGLCFYQAQANPQGQQTTTFDGDTVSLDISGEVCQ